MKHIFSKLKMSVTALTLCFVTLVSLALMPLCRKIVVFADGSINDIDYVETLYTNGGMTEDELAVDELEINETYGQFLAFNGAGELTFSENIQSMDGLDPEIVEMVQNNVDAMNFLVEEGVGYINGDAEFVFTETDDYFQQFRAWGFNLRWNRMWASFDKDFAVVIAGFFIAAKLFYNYNPKDYRAPNINQMLNDLQNETFLSNTVELAKEEVTGILDDRILSHLNNELIGSLIDIFITAREVISTSLIFAKIMKVVVAFLMPPIKDCLLVLYNVKRFRAGVSITVCWIPSRRDRLGITLKTIR